MAELEEHLQRFARRELNLQALKRACVQLAGSDAAQAARLRGELLQARDAGVLRAREFEALEMALISVVLADSPAAAALSVHGDAAAGADGVAQPGGVETGDDDTTRVTGGAALRGDADTTVVRPPAPGGTDIDRTRVRPPASPEQDADRNTPAADATRERSERSTRTRRRQGQPGDTAPTSMDAEDGDRTRLLDTDGDLQGLGEAAARAARAAGDTDGAATWDPSAPTEVSVRVERVFAPGSVLKDRFRLIDALGEGGMGTVWKAVDILKLEAQDRNPYVAIKLLQGDFKAHPEAFIALQRESSKQQRLAHPNIATVFDFDREAESGTVFMTMEVMNGCDLADYIKTLPQGGLSYAEAMPLIEQLGAGLAYAHKAGLVHSDLKPGNCFLTDEGNVKLLDFGIARASATRDDAEGEQTKFDPGQLGALTPSYATIEMFQGLDPDPRDDIYALAIIAYQLFTGSHPYNRRSAPRALEEGLAPDPVDKLNKRQNRTLAQGLAFERAERSVSVEDFLQGLRPHQRNLGVKVGLPLALAAALVAGLWTPVVDHLAERQREALLGPLQAGDATSIETLLRGAQDLDDPAQRQRVLTHEDTVKAVVALIAAGDADSVAAGLDLAGRLPDSAAAAVKLAPAAQDAVFALYEARKAAHFEPDAGRFDFAAALTHLEELSRIYPNLERRFDTRDALYELREAAVAAQGERLHALLAEGRLLPEPGADDVGAVLADLRSMQAGPPAPPLPALQDILQAPAIAAAYVERARVAIDAGDYEAAERVLAIGLRHAPDSADLAALSQNVLAELKRIRDTRRADQLQALLAPAWPGFVRLDDFAEVREQMLELAELRATSPVLAQMRAALTATFQVQFGARVDAGETQVARDLLRDYAGLFEFAVLRELRGRLDAAGVGTAAAAAVQPRQAAIETLLGDPEFTSAWSSALAVPYKELLALLPGADPRLQDLGERAAQVLAAHARVLAARHDYEAAFTLLERAQAYHPGWQGLAGARSALTEAETAHQAALAEAERLARLQTLRSLLLERAADDDPEAARRALAELREGLPADDAFVTEQAPAAIAQAELRVASVRAAAGDLEAALQGVERGLALAPDLAALRDARDSYLTGLRARAAAAQVQAPVMPRPRPAPGVEQGSVLRLAPADALRNAPPLADGLAHDLVAGVDPSAPAGAALQPGPVARGGAVPVPPRIGDSGGGADLAAQPPASPATGAAMAAQVAEVLLARVSGDAAAILALRSPLDSFALLYPEAQPALAADLAAAVQDAILRRAARSPGDMQPVAASLQAHQRLFPQRHAAYLDALRPEVATQLIARVAASPAAIEQAATLLRAYEEQFPDGGDEPRATVLVLLGEHLLALARDAEREQLEAAYPHFVRVFPGAADALGERLVPMLIEAAVDAARGAAADPLGLQADLATLRRLFPGAADGAETQVAEALVEALVAEAGREPLPVDRFAARLDAFRELLPAHRARVDEPLATVLAAALRERVSGEPDALGELAGPLQDLYRLLPEQTEMVASTIGPAALDAVERSTREAPADLAAAARRVTAVEGLFPRRGGQARERLAPLVAEAQLLGVRGADTDLASASAQLRAFASAFPEQAAALRADVAGILWRAIERDADEQPGQLGAVAQRLAAFQRTFPDEHASLSAALAARTARVVERSARDRGVPIDALDEMLAQFEALFPAAHADIASAVGASLAERVAGTELADAAAVTRLAPTLSLLREQDDAGHASVTQRLGERLAQRVRGLQQQDPFAAAELLEAARRIVPGHAALLVEQLLADARQANGDARVLATALARARSSFAETMPALERELAVILSAALAARLEAAGDLSGPLAAMLAAQRELLPEQQALMDARLAPVLAASLQARAAEAVADPAVLAGPLARFEALFPGAVPAMYEALGAAAAGELAARLETGAVARAELGRLLTGLRTMVPGEALEGPLRETVLPVLHDALAARVAADVESLRTLPEELAALQAWFPGSTERVRARLGALALEGLENLAPRAPLAQFADLLDLFLGQFADLGPAAETRLGPALGERLLGLARNGEVAQLETPYQHFVRVFPGSASGLAERLAPLAVDALVRDASAAVDLVSSVAVLRRLLPASVPMLEARLLPVLTVAAVDAARGAAADPLGLQADLATLRRLFPGAADAAEAQVAEALVEALVAEAGREPLPVDRFAARLDAFRELLPAHRARIDEPLATVLAAALRERVSGEPDALAGLAGPLQDLYRLLPEQTEVVATTIAPAALDAVERATRAAPADLAAATRRVAAVEGLFPRRGGQARERLAPLVAEAQLLGVRAADTDLASASAQLQAFASAFPEQAAVLRADVAGVLWRAIERDADEQPGQLGAVAQRLATFQRTFPDEHASLSAALAARTARVVERSARDPGVPIDALDEMLAQFEALFPAAHADIASAVGASLAERVAGTELADAAAVTRLAPTLSLLREQDDAGHASVTQRLGERLAQRVRGLQQQDPFAAAELLEAARRVVPGHTELATLRVQLPLREVQDGVRLVGEGMLSKAGALLDQAVARDPRHDSIPAFQRALEARRQQALAAYQGYLQVLRSSRRSTDHSRALARARALWRDNPEFKDLQPPAPHACIASKAGLGARVPCYDKVGERRTEVGPEMVVVPAGGGIAAPFAISRYEVSITDYNRFCSLSRSCEPRTGNRNLPMTNIDVAEIRRYAAWLSELSGARYRLPSVAEWTHAASADGQQPRKDFNCTVIVGGQQLKGLSLAGVKSGPANGWGVANYLGNVQELVVDGGSLAVRGGSFRDRLQDCDIGLGQAHAGDGDELTGFRLLRELSDEP